MMIFRKFASTYWMAVTGLCLSLLLGSKVFGEIISYTSEAAPVFGGSTQYGDTLLFGPTAFSSTSTGPAGVNMTDGLLRVLISSAAGIDNVAVNEGGAYFFFGPDATKATQAYVGAHAAELFITGVNGVPVSAGPLIGIPGTMEFSPASSDVGSATYYATEPVDTSGWQGTMLFDNLSAALADSPYAGGQVTDAMLVFDNILATASETGTTAYIDKKWVSITTTPLDAIPEPGTLVLFVPTMAILGLAILSLQALPAGAKHKRSETCAAVQTADSCRPNRDSRQTYG